MDEEAAYTSASTAVCGSTLSASAQLHRLALGHRPPASRSNKGGAGAGSGQGGTSSSRQLIMTGEEMMMGGAYPMGELMVDEVGVGRCGRSGCGELWVRYGWMRVEGVIALIAPYFASFLNPDAAAGRSCIHVCPPLPIPLSSFTPIATHVRSPPVCHL